MYTMPLGMTSIACSKFDSTIYGGKKMAQTSRAKVTTKGKRSHAPH